MAKSSDSKLWAFLAVLLSIVGFLLVFLLKRDDKYAMYYAKQSLIVFIGFVIAMGVKIIPFVGDFASAILWLVLIILYILALVYSLSGEMKATPLVGEFADNVKL